jgi:hypothetical protein
MQWKGKDSSYAIANHKFTALQKHVLSNFAEIIRQQENIPISTVDTT